ncbi:MAG: hypothetical protein WA148_07265, partial [Actinomycetota bacterium]
MLLPDAIPPVSPITNTFSPNFLKKTFLKRTEAKCLGHWRFTIHELRIASSDLPSPPLFSPLPSSSVQAQTQE